MVVSGWVGGVVEIWERYGYCDIGLGVLGLG